MYFALSRVRSLPVLYFIFTLSETVTTTAVNTDPRAIQEYKKLRLESLLLSQTFLFVSCNSLTINEAPCGWRDGVIGHFYWRDGLISTLKWREGVIWKTTVIVKMGYLRRDFAIL